MKIKITQRLTYPDARKVYEEHKPVFTFSKVVSAMPKKLFTSQENFARFIIIESKNKEKPITSLSPFVIEKQIEAHIGTAKSVKKLKNETLLVETTRKTQTEKLKKLDFSSVLQWLSLNTKV